MEYSNFLNNTIEESNFSYRNIKRNKDINNLKKLIWIYFVLIIFEGALRKWIFPSLASPLLVVRDPVAIAILILGIKGNLIRKNIYILLSVLITSISFVFTLIWGHGNVYVALYGARITIIHFPCLFIIGKVFTFEDVIKVGKVILWLTPPMTLLVAMQFYSPQSAWVNRGIGGDETGGGFSGTMGYFRPPGTFSFISGLISFYGLVAVFIFYFWFNSFRSVNKIYLLFTTVCLLSAIPFSISRSLLFTVFLTLLFTIISASKNTRLILRLVVVILGGLFVFFILSNFDFFSTSTQVFADRFNKATDAEGGFEGVLVDRFLGGLFGAIVNAGNNDSFWGMGIGIGTNAGTKLFLGNNKIFLISEGEWGRMIGEMGPLLGLLFISMRIHLAFKFLNKSFKVIRKENVLPWLLTSFTFLYILQGQWAQPTALGFTIFSGGLLIASFKKDNIIC